MFRNKNTHTEQSEDSKTFLYKTNQPTVGFFNIFHDARIDNFSNFLRNRGINHSSSVVLKLAEICIAIPVVLDRLFG